MLHKKRFAALLLVIAILLPMIPLAVAAPVSGRSFTANEMLRLDKTYATMPNTFEAWVYFPKDTAASTRGGVLLGNYKGSSNEINFEIYTNGSPRIYYIDGSGTVYSKIFTGVNVYTGEWTHIAVVRDKSAGTLSCYVNGALTESCSMTIPNIIPATPMQLGGDYRSGNSQYFKGKVASVAVYKDVRTAAEIRSDMDHNGAGDPLCAWDLSSNSITYTDLSGNGYHIAAGDTFTSGDVYKTRKTVTAMPNTFEAWLYFPKDTPASTRGGTILGNFKSGETHTTNFEIYTNGNPRIYYCDANGKTVSHVFTKVNVYTGQWVHLAVVRNASAGTVSCYVDGSLKESASLSVSNFNPNRGLVIGGDHRTDNGSYFKGRLRSVAIYSDARSQSEIKTDMTTVGSGDPMAFWEIGASNVSCYPDLSGNGNHAIVGKGFESNLQYRTVKALTAMPNTVEAWIYFAKSTDTSTRGGTIFSNYPASSHNVLSFEIYTKGNPRIFFKGPDGTTYTKTFSTINVYRGEWLHIAFVRNAKNSTIGCYINGVLEESATLSMPDFVPAGPFTVGGDQRGDNSQYFKGIMSAVAAYSDVRSQKELKADMNCIGNGDPIAYWNVSKKRASYQDLSGRGYTLEQITTWVNPADKEAVTEFDYTFAVVGDTQKVTEYDNLNGTKNLNKIYDWILSQKDKKNIQYVMGLGDITENGSVEAEWKLALNAINKLNGKIPYSLVRGNHDKSNMLNKYFGDSSKTSYPSSLEGTYDGKIENSWRTITVGTDQIPYLIMCLDYGPTDAVLNWASGVIEAHPQHNVIITTHAYLISDGTTIDKNDNVPPSASVANGNNGDMMWEKFVKKHENISMVLSGHDPCAQIIVRQDKADHGNIVTQMLIDTQTVDTMILTGAVALFHFSKDGRRVQVEYYSTLQEKYYLSSNQFEMEVHVVDSVVEPVLDESLKLNHTLNLASDISVNFAVQTSLLSGYDMDTVYLEVETDEYEGNLRTGTSTVRLKPVLNGSYYYFTLEGMTAVHINNELRAVLYGTKDGQTYYSETDDYSIADYAYSQLGKTGISTKLQALCAELLRYGSAAQTFKAYRTDALADRDMAVEYRALLTDLNTVTFGNTNVTLNDLPDPSITWAGKSLNLESKVALKFVFGTAGYSGNLDDLNLRVSYTNIEGETVTTTVEDVEDYNLSNQQYAFSFDGLLAAELRSVVSVQIYEKDTPVSCTLRYSADTYGNNKTGTLGTLCKALFAYSDSAKAYFQ